MAKLGQLGKIVFTKSFQNVSGKTVKNGQFMAKPAEYFGYLIAGNGKKVGKLAGKALTGVSKLLNLAQTPGAGLVFGATALAAGGIGYLLGNAGSKKDDNMGLVVEREDKPETTEQADTTKVETTKEEVKERYHVVEKGDNVWNIAKSDIDSTATNADVQKRTNELMERNNLKYENKDGLVLIYPQDTVYLDKKAKPEEVKVEKQQAEEAKKEESYFEKYRNTEAGQKALELDRADGSEDGRILAKEWNKFAVQYGGKEINNFIEIDDALKSITSYMVQA